MSLGKVLVVDDDAAIRQSVRLTLTKAGYQVVEAEDGKAGVAEAKSGDNPLMLNAILCDLQMPKMSGMEAIPFFRSQFPSCPIIVLTGTGTVENAAALMKQGVTDLLTKPVNNDALLEAVKKAVDQSGYRDQFAT